MKTKNVRVRLKDIKVGRRMFVSHPVYGIEEMVCLGKPVMHHFDFGMSELKVPVMLKLPGWGKSISDTYFLSSAGILNGESYNHRRTFFKRKHAEEWAKKMLTDPQFIKAQTRHEEMCRDMRDDFYDWELTDEEKEWDMLGKIAEASIPNLEM